MAIRFQFDHANRILLARFEGPLSDESLAEVSQNIRRQLKATDAHAGIFDFSGVTEFRVSTDFVHHHSRNGNQPFQDLAGVVVVPRDVAYGLARMFQIVTEKTLPLFRVAKTMDEAIQILRADEANFEPLQET